MIPIYKDFFLIPYKGFLNLYKQQFLGGHVC